MSYKPQFNHRAKVTVFHLQKPIYGSYYCIWDKWLNKTKKLGFKMVVFTNEGKSTFKNVKEYMDGATENKRYFKNPDVPMIFWGRHFKPDVDDRKLRKKTTKQIIEDYSPTMSVMLRLKKEWDKLEKKKYA